MITKEEVEKLAKLARVKVPAGELDKLAKDMEAILGYVSELKSAPVYPSSGAMAAEGPEIGQVKNVLRDDADAHEAGLYTADLVKAFAKSRDNYLSVKPILTKNE